MSSTSNSGRSKSKREKRHITGLRTEGELTDSESNDKESFTNSTSHNSNTGNTGNNNSSNTSKNSNNSKLVSKNGNIFKENTGSQFDKLLNQYVKSHREELEDNVFNNI